MSNYRECPGHARWKPPLAAVLGGLAILTLTGCGGSSAATAPSSSNGYQTGSKARWSSAPPMTINVNGHYTATVKTNLGTFVIDLFAKRDPVAVNNFVFLAQHQFYNGDKIFRILKPFVFQTGDPTNTGTGGPGYQFHGELPPPVPYAPGVVAYANANNPNTNGSQFFVCTGAESKQLNQSPTYTEIGQVTPNTMAVVKRIAAVPVANNPKTGEDSLPKTPVIVQSITTSGS